jgi:hypothetical protein
MRLKRYLEFIKETLYINNIPTDFSLDKETLEDLFWDFVDNDWSIHIESGFNQDGEFNKLITTGVIRPAYWINLKTTSSTTSNDLTVFLKELLNRLIDSSNGKIEIYDTHWDNNPEFITSDINDLGFTVAGGVVYGDLTHNEFSILLTENKEIDANVKFLCEYYKLDVDNIIDDTPYVHVDKETISSILFKDNYYLSLVKMYDEDTGPIDGFWEDYYSDNYQVDLISLMEYYINKENKTLLINAIIKEAGGIDELKNHIGNEMDETIYDKIKDLDQDKFVKFIESERFYGTLENISKYSDIMLEVNNTVADWSSSAHAEENFNELFNEFNSIIDENFNLKRRIKKQDETIYEIEFEMEWIKSFDHFDDIYDNSLLNILLEYSYNYGFYKRELNPNFRDFGDVNINKMNKEINNLLLRFLNK